MAVVAVALGIAAAALLLVLERSLESSTDTASLARARVIATQLSGQSPPEVTPELLATTGQASVVQVVDSAGAVLLASAGAPSKALIPPRTTAVIGGETREYRVQTQAVSGGDTPYTVVVGAEQDPITETLSTVTALLALGLPIIVVVAGAATYTLVGRSLRPVERMRSRVGEITTADLSERLPIPRARDEITALAVTLNAMLGRIEAGHAAQRRFVGDASHELRSPLATVTAALELGSERPEILDRALLTETLLPEAQRMQHLVDDLLLLAKADERGLALRVVDVDLDDILQAEVGRIRLTSGHTVVAEIAPTRVRGDAVALARVIRNLTDNAVRHARSRVVLSCAWAGGTATVTVADDGPGIAVDERQRVLQRFVRLDTGRARAAGGSGLGLAIVAEIVDAHRGGVEVGESAGGGTSVVVRLPLDGPGQPPSLEKR